MTAVLTEAGMTVRRSLIGTGEEKAVTESFFGTLTSEGVERPSFQTRGQARSPRMCGVLFDSGTPTFFSWASQPACFRTIAVGASKL